MFYYKTENYVYMLSLGFMIKLEESNLVPTQNFVYIGALFNLRLGLAFPSIERYAKILIAIEMLNQSRTTARDVMHLLGSMASCIELVRLTNSPIHASNYTF